MSRYQLNSPPMQTLFQKIIPAPNFAFLGAYIVLITRSLELEKGIEVMDKDGTVLGMSQNAGAKAIKETALTRATLLGTSVVVPDFLLYFLKRTNILLRNPRNLLPLKFIITIFVTGVMIPVSFSMFPQVGKIRRADLEPEILSSAEETEFFYYRGI
uniref:Sideroflexin-4 n=1 Tax=Sphenodon punctatus TaxID=8508 RepID=A0A8D0GC94_SPHPU